MLNKDVYLLSTCLKYICKIMVKKQLLNKTLLKNDEMAILPQYCWGGLINFFILGYIKFLAFHKSNIGIDNHDFNHRVSLD